jgi:hypothetical protein
MQREELEKLNAKRKMIREHSHVVVVDHGDDGDNKNDGHDGHDGHDGMMIIKAKTKKMKKCEDDDINGKKKNEIKSKKIKKIVSEISNDRIENDNNSVSIDDNMRVKEQKSIKNADKKSKEVINKNTLSSINGNNSSKSNEVSSSSCNNNSNSNGISIQNRRRHHHIDEEDINGKDPISIIDKSFQSDWEYLHRQHNKNKFEFNNWLLLWKNLKIFNNNWRVVAIPIHHHYDHDQHQHHLDGVGGINNSNSGVSGDDNNHIFYTRVPGLKYENYQQYRKNYDYFLTLSELKLYIFTQGMLISGDKNLLSFINNDDSSSSSSSSRSSSSSSSSNHDKINLSKKNIETNITTTKNNCERIKSHGKLSCNLLSLLYIICYF